MKKIKLKDFLKTSINLKACQPKLGKSKKSDLINSQILKKMKRNSFGVCRREGCDTSLVYELKLDMSFIAQWKSPHRRVEHLYFPSPIRKNWKKIRRKLSMESWKSRETMLQKSKWINKSSKWKTWMVTLLPPFATSQI